MLFRSAGKLRARRLLRIKVDQLGRRGIETDEIRRRGTRSGRQLGVEGLGQAGVGIVEIDLFKLSSSGHAVTMISD